MRNLLPLPILLLSVLTACSSPPRNSGAIPASFEASLTVLIDPGEPVQDDAGVLAPARFVVEADGWLRAGRGTGIRRTSLPPRVRRLTTTDRDRFWRLLRGSGLLDADDPVRIASGDGPVPDRLRPLLVIAVRTGHDRHAGAVPLKSSLAEPYLPMLELLHDRAWMSP